MSSASFLADPESTRVVVQLSGPDGSETFECIVRHFGQAVVDVRFPAGWRNMLADIGLDAFEIETEELIVSRAETAFARIVVRESVKMAKAFVVAAVQEVA